MDDDSFGGFLLLYLTLWHDFWTWTQSLISDRFGCNFKKRKHLNLRVKTCIWELGSNMFQTLFPFSPFYLKRWSHLNLDLPPTQQQTPPGLWTFWVGNSILNLHLWRASILIGGVPTKDIYIYMSDLSRKGAPTNFQPYTRWCFQICFIFIPTWGNDPSRRAYFSDGLKPPTSYTLKPKLFWWDRKTPHDS